jgi:hypothetical protein
VQARDKFERRWHQTSPLEQLLQAESLGQKGLAGLSWDRLKQKMVAWGGIEPPTQGFSIHTCYYFSLLIDASIINVNQQLTILLLIFAQLEC